MSYKKIDTEENLWMSINWHSSCNDLLLMLVDVHFAAPLHFRPKELVHRHPAAGSV